MTKLLEPNLMSWVNEGFVFIDLEANSATDVIQFLSRQLLNAGFVKVTFEEAVLEREKIFPTGLPTPEIGVAIPHTDPEHVIKPTIAIAILKKPVTFGEMGYPESTVAVRIVCLLALDGKKQVELLSKVAEAIQDVSFLMRVCNEKNTAEIADLFNTRLGI